MGKEDSASSSATTDTSSVTAIKVKVVLDTTTEELKNQFKGVQNSFKKTPVEIAFGINEGATIGNVNAALRWSNKVCERSMIMFWNWTRL